MKHPTLIFDLGGVLVNIEYHRFIETLGIDHTIDEAELLRILSPEARQYESGTISTKDFFHRVNQHLDRGFTETQLHEAWYAILAGEIDGMRNLVEKLSTQGPLYLLSNTNELHFEYAKKKFPILSFFSQHFVSYKIGAMKPSPEIYRHVIHSLNTNPSDVLFIDDLQHNVDGAKNVGLQTYLFTGVDSLRRMLAEQGFSIP